MRVLVACESSGIVRDEFRRKGHDAWSCDFLDTEIFGNHIKGDVLEILDDGWDLMIAHPPCTYLSSSGLHWNKRIEGREEKTKEAIGFVRFLLSANISRIALENPIGRISTAIRKPDQIIQPWMFGENASKATCLWLKNLPRLVSTDIVPPKGYQLVKFASDMESCDCCEDAWCDEHDAHFSECFCFGPTQDGIEYKEINGYLFGTDIPNLRPLWANQTPSGQNKLGPSPTRAKERSRTYIGIAEAMASQWGQLFP